MIHVTPQPEPADFDKKVREKGARYLADQGLDPNQPLPPNTRIPPLWRDCLDDLYRLYSGTCAYLAVHFERVMGAGTVEHFIAKSSTPALAYEWDNYRLVCSHMNSRKRDFDDVLDPFCVKDGWFHLELVSGRVFANPNLTNAQIEQVNATIKRLGLDDSGCREMRARHFQEYCQGHNPAVHLRKRSPFVWMEAHRQGLLRTF